jgi:hypothetical protein
VVAKNGQTGFLDFETSKPDKLDAEIVEMFEAVNRPRVGDDRLRLDDGRGPRQARSALIAPWASSSTSSDADG